MKTKVCANYSKYSGQGTPVLFNGVKYPSLRIAAKLTGKSVSTIKRFYENQKNKTRPIDVDGEYFPSALEAAINTPYSRRSIGRNSPYGVFTGASVVKNRRSGKVTFNGKTFTDCVEAEKILGVSRRVLQRYAKEGRTKVPAKNNVTQELGNALADLVVTCVRHLQKV